MKRHSFSWISGYAESAGTKGVPMEGNSSEIEWILAGYLWIKKRISTMKKKSSSP